MGNTCFYPAADSNPDLSRFMWTTSILLITVIIVIDFVILAFPMVVYGNECEKADDKEIAKTHFIIVGSLTMFLILFLCFFLIAFKDTIFNFSSCTSVSNIDKNGTNAFFTGLGIFLIILIIPMLVLGSISVNNGANNCVK